MKGRDVGGHNPAFTDTRSSVIPSHHQALGNRHAPALCRAVASVRDYRRRDRAQILVGGAHYPDGSRLSASRGPHDNDDDGDTVAMRQRSQLRLLVERQHLRGLVNLGRQVHGRGVCAHRCTLERSAPVVRGAIAGEVIELPVIDNGHGAGLRRGTRHTRDGQKDEPGWHTPSQQYP